MKPLNIVIPMAGRGSRFAQKGFSLPKPLIEIRGIPMIQLVLKNIAPSRPHRFVILCLKEHLSQYSLEKKLKTWVRDPVIVSIDHVTEGAACTVLCAKDFVDNSNPLMIANSDQWVDMSIDAYLEKIDEETHDGFIMTMTANHPKWSYLQLKHKAIAGVVEKQVVSDEATVGIYNFARGSDFVAAAESMVKKNLRVNNEFYVAPVYNEMIGRGQHVGFYNIGSVEDKMFGLGTPEDLEIFLSSKILPKALAQAQTNP